MEEQRTDYNTYQTTILQVRLFFRFFPRLPLDEEKKKEMVQVEDQRRRDHRRDHDEARECSLSDD